MAKAKFYHRQLSAGIAHPSWEREGAAHPLFALDLVRSGVDQLSLVLPALPDASSFLKTLEFLSDAKTVTLNKFDARTNIATFDAMAVDRLTVSSKAGSVNIAVNTIETDLFEGQNVLFAITNDIDPDHLKFWLKQNIKTHGATAAIILRRVVSDDEQTIKIEKICKQMNGLKMFVLLDCDAPLGDLDGVALHEAYVAPDAPGKALMDVPKSDAQRSEMVHNGIYEIVRNRFLSKAAAVLKCDVEDIMMPLKDGQKTIFEQAIETPTYLKFSGVRVYPWRLRNEDRAEYSDHICQRFDNPRSESNWCVSPKRKGTWRAFRAMNVEPDPISSSYSYWRFMALFRSHLTPSKLAPKSSLVKSEALFDFIKKTTNSKPILPPKTEEGMAKAIKNDRILIVTTMKNEGPFLLEWIAYHRSIGVTDFLVYTNDCTDGTDDFFDLLQEKGIVVHKENPYRELDMKPQHAAYLDASSTELFPDMDWVIGMDVDEYINVHVGDGTLNALFDAVGDANVISMTWRLFGNAEIEPFEDKFITEQFFRCAPEICKKPHQAWGVKTLFRNIGHYKKLGVHRPKGLKPEYHEEVNWVNGSGNSMPTPFLRTGWRSDARSYGYNLVSLHHYSLRSAKSFLVKRDRGRVNHVDRDQGLTYWFRMNHNAVEDRTILRNLPRAQIEFDKFMSDPEIKKMHDHCVKAHALKINELLEGESYQNFYSDITSDRLNSLSKMLHNFGTQVFLDGPDSIDKDFHLNNPTYEKQHKPN